MSWKDSQAHSESPSKNEHSLQVSCCFWSVSPASGDQMGLLPPGPLQSMMQREHGKLWTGSYSFCLKIAQVLSSQVLSTGKSMTHSHRLQREGIIAPQILEKRSENVRWTALTMTTSSHKADRYASGTANCRVYWMKSSLPSLHFPEGSGFTNRYLQAFLILYSPHLFSCHSYNTLTQKKNLPKLTLEYYRNMFYTLKLISVYWKKKRNIASCVWAQYPAPSLQIVTTNLIFKWSTWT